MIATDGTFDSVNHPKSPIITFSHERFNKIQISSKISHKISQHLALIWREIFMNATGKLPKVLNVSIPPPPSLRTVTMVSNVV